ncbi:MAG: ribose-phosphate pyrophosphokinase [Filifactor alocis]|nr:ribose-phosphate pyrophosphokinase [Filifactor alocis]
MILINKRELDRKKFPDGTPLLHCEPCEEARIEWFYESDEELFQLLCVARHLREGGTRRMELFLPYLPNARMDRVKHRDEVFTLKYFCEWINSLSFDAVEVTDVHSDVGRALLNNIVPLTPKKALERVLDRVGREDLVIYFPDEGASKRYVDLLPGFATCYGRKVRDWKSGKILGLEIVKGDLDLKGAKVLMVDDICSYGGTFYYSVAALKEEGVDKICSFATHTEASLLSEKSKYLQLLKSGEVERHFTTRSLHRDESEYIEEVSNEA